MTTHEILAQRLQQQHEHLRSLIGHYMQWFVFFWGINIGALGWFLSKENKKVAASLLAGAYVMAFMNLLGTATSLSMISVVRQMCAGIKSATAQLIAGAVPKSSLGQEAAPLLQESPYPVKFVVWAFVANATSLIVLIVAWLLIARGR